MKYVFIVCGWTKVFTSSNRYEAVEKSKELARNARVYAWLLYDEHLNLIADCYAEELL